MVLRTIVVISAMEILGGQRKKMGRTVREQGVSNQHRRERIAPVVAVFVKRTERQREFVLKGALDEDTEPHDKLLDGHAPV